MTAGSLITMVVMADKPGLPGHGAGPAECSSGRISGNIRGDICPAREIPARLPLRCSDALDTAMLVRRRMPPGSFPAPFRRFSGLMPCRDTEEPVTLSRISIRTHKPVARIRDTHSTRLFKPLHFPWKLPRMPPVAVPFLPGAGRPDPVAGRGISRLFRADAVSHSAGKIRPGGPFPEREGSVLSGNCLPCVRSWMKMVVVPNGFFFKIRKFSCITCRNFLPEPSPLGSRPGRKPVSGSREHCPGILASSCVPRKKPRSWPRYIRKARRTREPTLYRPGPPNQEL